MPSAILYDFDGTLADTLPGIEAAVRAAAAQVDASWRLPALRPLIGPPLRRMVELALPLGRPDQWDEIVRRFKELYDGGLCLECGLYSGVQETLQSIHSRVGSPRPFVVTNKRAIPTHLLLRHFGVEQMFEAVIASDSPPGFASKGDAVGWTLKHFGLSAADILFVGDSRDDYEAALQNEVPFLPVSYGYGEATKHAPGRSLDSFADLTSHLTALFPS